MAASFNPALLVIEITRSGVRKYIDQGMTREKPNYALRLKTPEGEVVFENLRCADNAAHCGNKGQKWIDHYIEHGEFPA